MFCPYCRQPDSRVLDSRVSDDGSSIRRRRECKACGRRFSTLEQTQLSVLKRSGVSEPFSRDKVIAGVRKACKGRPVSESQLAKLGQQVEEAVRAMGVAEVPTDQVGLAILEPLKELDAVAYLRFASVYKNYSSEADFIEEINRLHEGVEPRTDEGPTPGPAPSKRGKKARSEPAESPDQQLF